MIETGRVKKMLIISLVLNVFLIGSIAGSAYHLFWSDRAPLGKNSAQLGLRFAADNLSHEQQRAFRRSLREARHDASDLIQEGQQARGEVRKLLTAPSFDRKAIQAQIDRTRQADIALRMRVENSLLNFAESLSAEDRQKLAAGLAQRGPLREQLKQFNKE